MLREQSRGDGTDVSQTILGALTLCWLAAPLGYCAARLASLQPAVAASAVMFGLTIVLFDTSQEMLRARQNATAYMRGTIARTILVSVLGIGGAFFGSGGAILLASSSIAYFLATLTFWRRAWGNSTPRFDVRELLVVAKTGAPLTLSLTLLAVAGVTDRFLLAKLSGSGAAGDFGASFDLVRQALIIPAVSVASAFVPMTVQIFATRGVEAARCHLEKCLEILLAICLPACVGYALVSGQIADFALGPDFRQTAHEAMPYLAIGVVFQILNQQYMHTSFLLSKRNTFYLINSGSILLFNVIVSALLIPRFGVMGAVWGRVGTEAFGFFGSLILSRSAFAMPFPLDRILRVRSRCRHHGACRASSRDERGGPRADPAVRADPSRNCGLRDRRLVARHRRASRGSARIPARALAPWRGFAVRMAPCSASRWIFAPTAASPGARRSTSLSTMRMPFSSESAQRLSHCAGTGRPRDC